MLLPKKVTRLGDDEQKNYDKLFHHMLMEKSKIDEDIEKIKKDVL
jgi:hypothetical protein